MKIVAISDVHGDAVTAGVRRFDEVQRSVLAAMATALHEKADALVFCGDLCDPDSGVMMVWCVELALDVARQLERRGVHSIWIAGNHDVGNDGEGTTTIDPLNALASSDRGDYAFVERVPKLREWRDGRSTLEPSLVHVATESRFFMIRGVEFMCLPYPSVATSYDPARAVEGCRTRIGPLVILSHLQLRGMIPGEESTEMPRGREVWFPEDALVEIARARPTIVLQGHYHRRQVFTTKSGLPIQTVGSIATFSHGEDRGIPGYVVVDVPE